MGGSNKARNCILKYLDNQTTINLSDLGFNIIKTRQNFLDNYQMHDLSTKHVVFKYLQNNFSLHPIGKDLRKQMVMINNEVPDYFVEKMVDIENESDNIYFCFDVKSKKKIDFFGWVNERSIKGYKMLQNVCNVKIFLVFVLIENGKPTEQMGFVDIDKEPSSQRRAWDGNMVNVYKWDSGIPHLKNLPD